MIEKTVGDVESNENAEMSEWVSERENASVIQTNVWAFIHKHIVTATQKPIQTLARIVFVLKDLLILLLFLFISIWIVILKHGQ